MPFRRRRVAALAATLLLGACSTPARKVGDAGGSERLQVVTTFLPITTFTKAVAGDCADVQALIPANVGPHDFQATPADLTRLQQADVLVKNGLGLEGFLAKLIESAGNSDLKVIDSSKGVATLANPEGRHGHEPGHDGDHGDEKDHGHSHAAGAVNPHIWLDPLRAVQQVETIRDGLIAAAPACKDTFTAKAASFSGELRNLNAELAAQLKPFAGKTFVAFHDFAPYFAERYGLKATFLVDVPEINPTPADLQRVAKEVKATELKAVLSEPQEGSRTFNALAQDLGVKVSVFDPLETGPLDAASQPGSYAETLRRNVSNLVGAFGGAPAGVR